MNKVAIGRVVLTNREHIIALEPLEKGLVGTLLRYPNEVRSADEYFDEIEDVKVTKDMLDLARHIVTQKSGNFEPDKFEDQYETALVDLINRKRAGKPITAKERPRGENVVDLMEALRRSVGGTSAETRGSKKSSKKPCKAAAGQKALAPAAAALASAVSRIWRSARIIACAAARSDGSDSAASFMRRWNHIRRDLQVKIVSRPRSDARFPADGASRSRRASNRAGRRR
jgi:hypothetical protein